jgi:hypothetical protein
MAAQGPMKYVELEHPAVLETIRRILTGENSVPTAAVRDFDGNILHVTVDLKQQEDKDNAGQQLTIDEKGRLFSGGSVKIEAQHSLTPAFLEKSGARPFLQKVLERHFAHDKACFKIGAGGDKYAVTVTLDTSNKTVAEVLDHPTVRKASQLRLLVALGPFLLQFERFLVSKSAGADLPFMELPFARSAGGGGNEARMFLYSANANFVSLLWLRVPDMAERIFVRVFLNEMQGLSGNVQKGLNGCIGMSFNTGEKKAPSWPASAPGCPALSEDSFWVTFVFQKRHMDGTLPSGDLIAERSVRSVMDFRAFLSYHVSCCKSNLHASMRRRADESLKTIQRAKTKLTGKPKIQIEG